MRVIANLISLFQGGPRVIGFGIVSGIARTRSDHEWVVILPTGVGYEELVRTERLEDRVRSIIFCRYPSVRPRFVHKLLLDHVYVPWVYLSYGADAVLMAANFASIGLPGPKQVVLQHNVHYLEKNNPFASSGMWQKIKYALEKTLFHATARKQGLRFVVQSNCMKQKLTTRCRLRSENVRTIHTPPYLGGLRGADVSDLVSGMQRLADVLSRFAGRTRLIFPAQLHPNKNHDALLPLARLLQQRDCRVTIFVTLPSSAPLLSALKQEGLDQCVVNIGYIAHGLLMRAYTLFDALFFPSRSESYGLPYVEALSQGLPVLTTDADFSREICGDAALYFDANRVDQMFDAICRFQSTETRREMAARAYRVRETTLPPWEVVVNNMVTTSTGNASGG